MLPRDSSTKLPSHVLCVSNTRTAAETRPQAKASCREMKPSHKSERASSVHFIPGKVEPFSGNGNDITSYFKLLCRVSLSGDRLIPDSRGHETRITQEGQNIERRDNESDVVTTRSPGSAESTMVGVVRTVSVLVPRVVPASRRISVLDCRESNILFSTDVQYL